MSILPPYGTVAGEAARAVLVAVAFGTVFLAAEAWRRIGQPPGEWTRKLVHVAGGIVVGFFPWLFASHWTVLVLTVLATGALLAARRFGLLPSVTGVERRSGGDLFFPIAGYALFVLARDRPVFYVIALFTLVVSDTFASLLGQMYGRVVFRVGEDRKSLEGSVAFLTITFVAVHLLLLLGTLIGRPASVLIALQIALLVTSFEAISGQGIDNLVVPLGTYYLLAKMTPKSAESIAGQLGAQVGILLFVLLLAWRTGFLTLSGALAAHLVLYSAFSLGGPTWVAAPLGALAAFLALDARYGAPDPDGYQVRGIARMSAVAVLCIFADNSLAATDPIPAVAGSGHPFYALFLGALAAPVAIFALEARAREPNASRQPVLVSAVLAYAIGIGAVLPLGLGVPGIPIRLETVTVAALGAAMGLAAYLALRRRDGVPGTAADSLRFTAAASLVGTTLAWLVQSGLETLRMRGSTP